MRAAVACALFAAISLAAPACSGNGSGTLPSTVTETFSGTVPVGGSDYHDFTVNSEGAVNVTLTTAGPPSDVVMGLAVGLPTGTSCAPLEDASIHTAAGTSIQLPGLVTASTMCVVVSDIGNDTAAVNYTVTVAHP
jgi:hypothetical protein